MTKAMAATQRVELPFKEWPEADRRAWDGLFVAGDVLDAAGAGRHWAAATRDDQSPPLRPLACLAQAERRAR